MFGGMLALPAMAWGQFFEDVPCQVALVYLQGLADYGISSCDEDDLPVDDVERDRVAAWLERQGLFSAQRGGMRIVQCDPQSHPLDGAAEFHPTTTMRDIAAWRSWGIWQMDVRCWTEVARQTKGVRND